MWAFAVSCVEAMLRMEMIIKYYFTNNMTFLKLKILYCLKLFKDFAEDFLWQVYVVNLSTKGEGRQNT